MDVFKKIDKVISDMKVRDTSKSPFLSNNLVPTSNTEKKDLFTISKTTSRIIFFSIIVLVILIYMSSNRFKNVKVTGDLTLSNGNLTVKGDGYDTGSMQAEYVTLPDYTTRSDTYLWSDRNTLLWQSGTIADDIPPRENDVFGWTSKLAQTSVISTINPASATTSNIATAYNNLLQELYSRGIIFANPTPFALVVRSFNVFTSGTVTIPNVNTDPNDNVYFNNGGNNPPPRKQMAYGSFSFPSGITNVSQLQSVQLNFYAHVYRGGLDFSDSRFGLQLDDSQQCHYDYSNNPVPTARFTLENGDAPIGRNPSSITASIVSGNPASLDTEDLYFYDKNLLTRWFCDPNLTDGTLKTTCEFEGNWFCGYASSRLRKCRFTRFIINYIA